MKHKCKWVRLGDYIEQCDERNEALRYGLEYVMGMTITKKIIPTKANLSGNDLSKFKIVKPNEFIYNPRTHGKKIGLGINNSEKPFLISWNNLAFRICNEQILMPLYLYMIFNRDEWDRLACYNSWGSSTEVFSWEELCRMSIPLPSLSEQQKVVNAWKAFREIKEQNEAIAAPLMQVCQSYIQELKHKYDSVEIGHYITRIDKRNTDNSIKIVKSVSVTKEFNDTNAKVDKNNLSSYKVVEPGEISYVQTTGNEKCLCAAVNHYEYPIVVTSVNEVFKTNELFLLADFLHLWFRRKELDRYARFHSWGSARETFTWEDMKRMEIPLPPLNIQRAIVNIYNCANEAKKIAEEADKKSREVCPALIQYVINN